MEHQPPASPSPPPPPPGWAPPPPPSDQVRPASPARLRWGLGDFCAVFVGGLILAAVAGVIAAVLAHAVNDLDLNDSAAFSSDPIVVGFSTLGQFGGWFGAIWLVSRLRGLGTMRADFGLALRAGDAAYIALGVGMQIGLTLLLLPISSLGGAESQTIVEDIRDSPALTRALLVLTAVVGAPLVEELLFRGLFLRALLRRMNAVYAVLISGVVFGLTHTLDPNALASLPALCAVGVVSGVLAVRSGSLSQSILLHLGFNAIGVLFIVLS